MISECKNILSNLIADLDLKSASFVQEKNGFSLLLINKFNKAKEVRFGLDDEKQNIEDLLKEIKHSVKSQGW